MPQGLFCTPGENHGDRIVCAHCANVVSWLRLANNFNYKKLKREPFFGKPEVRAAIEMIHRRYPRHPLIQGWLLREARRGRLITTPTWQEDVHRLMQAEQSGDQDLIQQAHARLDSGRPDVVLFDHSHIDANGQPRPVQPGMIAGLGRMLDSASSQGQGIDLMQHEFPQFYPKYEEWSQQHRKHSPEDGEVVHAFPNGYTMRAVTSPDEAHTEAELMQNCVSKFAPHIGNGEFHLLSLRDEGNNPHANILIAPHTKGGHYEGGIIRDIRGKQNAKPTGEYAEMVKNFFDGMNDKPTVRYDPWPTHRPELAPPEPHEYGLTYHPTADQGPYPPEFLQQRTAALTGWHFTADRMDRLENEPGLQTDEMKQILEGLRGRFHSDKTDYMMPWLVRQIQRGNINFEHDPHWGEHKLVHQGDEGGSVRDRLTERLQERYDAYLRRLQSGEWSPSDLGEYAEDADPQEVIDHYMQQFFSQDTVSKNELGDIAEFLQSNHSTSKLSKCCNAPISSEMVQERREDGRTRNVDRNVCTNCQQVVKGKQNAIPLESAGTTLPFLRDRMKDFQAYMKNKRSIESRLPVDLTHLDPEGKGYFWKTLLPDEVTYEGTEMQNCIKNFGYDSKIGSMQSVLMSLRDKHGRPHISMEIRPEYAFDKKTKQVVPISDIDHDARYSWMADDQYVPVPNNGKVIQIQGKYNSAPAAKYHPLIKALFQSPLFNRGGEDSRPEWQLNTRHFTSMGDLWSGADDEQQGGQHICYYHPGDFGLPDAGVTSDYNSLVRSLGEMRYMQTHGDPDQREKALKHLANWAMHHGELDKLEEALHDEGNINALKGQIGGYGTEQRDPEYQRWMEANPQPRFDQVRPMPPEDPANQNPVVPCPSCGSTDAYYAVRTNYYPGDPHPHACRDCYEQFQSENPEAPNYLELPAPPGREEYLEAERRYQRENADYEERRRNHQQQQATWYEQNAAVAQAARARQTAAQWADHPLNAGTQQLQQFIDERKNLHSAGAMQWGLNPYCYCGFCDGQTWQFTAAFEVESNFNKTRNEYKRRNAWDKRMQLAMGALRHKFPEHEALAPWLMRRIEDNDTMSFSHPEMAEGDSTLQGRLEAAIGLVDQYNDSIADQERRIERYQHYIDNGDDDADYYQERIERSRERIEQFRLLAQDYQRKVDELREQVAQNPDQQVDYENDVNHDRAHFQTHVHHGGTYGAEIPFDSDLLRHVSLVARKRAQQAKAKIKDPAEKQILNGTDQEARQALLAKHGLKEPVLQNAPFREMVEDAHASLTDERARQSGKVIHTFPNGWTIRFINDQDTATNESDMLGHCIRQYGDRIESGRSLNFSIRDKQGKAKATFDMVDGSDPYGDYNNGHRFKYDWDKIISLQGGKHTPKICPKDGTPLTASGVCTECQTDWNASEPDERYNDYRPQQLQRFKDHAEGKVARGDMDYEDQMAYDRFRTDAIKAGHATPIIHKDLRGQQLQGASQKAPLPKYQQYLKKWMESIPYDQRPESHWGSYFATQPVQRVEQLPEFTAKTDEVGFRAPNRTINWESVLNSLHDKVDNWHMDYQRYNPVEHEGEEKYNPVKGQQLYEFARDNDMLMDLYKALNGYSKSPGIAGSDDNDNVPRGDEARQLIECPNQLARGCRAEAYYPHDNGLNYHYCGDCGGSWRQRVERPQSQGGQGPAFTPYQAAATDHLGYQLAQHPELVELGMHGAEQFLQPKCPNCGGQIGPCQTCPSATHGQCTQCHNLVNFPNAQRQASISMLPEDCPLRHKFTIGTHVGHHGKPCKCLYHPENQDVIQRQAMRVEAGFHRFADKLNDFLMNPTARPDLQKPEAQQFLQYLQQNYHNPQTDELMPWLVREWKKGRVATPTGPQNGQPGLDAPGYAGHLGYIHEGERQTLDPATLGHWADWYHSNHATRRGVDIMQMKAPDMHEKIKDWEDAMLQESGGAADHSGEVLHQWPDGWSIQNLTSADALKDEGQKMGHCVGGYHSNVQHGHSMILSLRDDKNEPHGTMEINPSHYECGSCGSINKRGRHTLGGDGQRACGCTGEVGENDKVVPHYGDIVQIQGKGNTKLKDEYQQRMKEFGDSYFDHPDEKPQWQGGEITDYDELDDNDEGAGYSAYGDMFGQRAPKTYNWYNIIDSVCDNSYADSPRDSYAADEIARHAIQAGEEGELMRAIESWSNDASSYFESDWASEIRHDPENLAERYGIERWEDSYERDRWMDDGPMPPDEDDYLPDDEDDEDEVAQKQEEFERAQEDYELELDDHHANEEEAKREYYMDKLEDLADSAYEDDPRAEFANDLHYSLQRQQRLAKVAKVRLPHTNFYTGEPCNCRFIRHLEPVEATEIDGTVRQAGVPHCDTCGDELQDGVYCQRCQWGGWNPVDSPEPMPLDPTRDLKGPYQSSVTWEW